MGGWLWKFTGRIALLTLVPTMLTLSGCWAVAGPLLGVGAVGTGVAVAEVEHSNKKQTQPPATRQPENGSEAAAQAGSPQFAAKNNAAPVVGTIQESTLPATPKAVPVDSAKKLAEASAQHDGERVAVRHRKPQVVVRTHYSKTRALPRSTPPSSLPETAIVD